MEATRDGGESAGLGLATRAVFEAYPGAKTRWFTPEQGHCAARVERYGEWWRRVTAFFEAAGVTGAGAGEGSPGDRAPVY